MVSVHLWFTFGWMLWGKFESEYQARSFISKHPNKQWKIETRKYDDNVID